MWMYCNVHLTHFHLQMEYCDKYIYIFLVGFFCFVVVFFFCFLGPHLRPMEVPRLGVQSELQLPAYTAPAAMQDPSHVCNLHHSSQQCWILSPLSETRDQTCNLMIPSRILSTAPLQELPILFIYLVFLSSFLHTVPRVIHLKY